MFPFSSLTIFDKNWSSLILVNSSFLFCVKNWNTEIAFNVSIFSQNKYISSREILLLNLLLISFNIFNLIEPIVSSIWITWSEKKIFILFLLILSISCFVKILENNSSSFSLEMFLPKKTKILSVLSLS